MTYICTYIHAYIFCWPAAFPERPLARFLLRCTGPDDGALRIFCDVAAAPNRISKVPYGLGGSLSVATPDAWAWAI